LKRPHLTRMSARWAFCVTIAAFPVTLQAQDQPEQTKPTVQQAQADQPASEAFQPEPTSQEKEPKAAPFRTKAWGARLETDPPGYVKPLSESGIPGLEKLDWLDFGLEHRTRFELRDDNYRRPVFDNDEQFLLRTRGYIGIRKILDPFRFGFEFEDARQFGSDFPESDREVDENDILQLFGELYFKDLLGSDQPLRFQVGRLSFDSVDRKLIGRNRFRNTTNAFDGFRLRLGQPDSDWQLDFFAVMPVERRLRQPDRSDEERWFYGLTGAWRTWSDIITLEPYYYILDEDRKDRDRADREIHTIGLHGFGPIARTAFDYDFNTAFQFGDDGDRKHRAFAAYSELGYTFKHDWKPRLSLSGTYASGDRDPRDGTSERFDRLFAPNHFRSTSDLFTWQNIISPKLRLELQPSKKLRCDASYGGYWLASDNDAWVVPGRRDPTGHSGDFVGQELELRFRYRIDKRIELETGYSHFIPGGFAENTGPADDYDSFYVQLTVQLP
jgi:hypothetical protein